MNIESGDSIFSQDNSWEKIRSIRGYSEQVQTYNLKDVTNSNTFFVEGLLAHNKTCFVAGTKVTMADGTLKNIEDVKVGEQVLSTNNKINRVTGLERPVVGLRKTYVINNKVEATGDHPFLTTEGWKVNDLEYKLRILESSNGVVQGENPITKDTISQLEVGDILFTKNGQEKVEKIEVRTDRPFEEVVYDLNLDGDHTYYANDYSVHNCGGEDDPVAPACCTGAPACCTGLCTRDCWEGGGCCPTTPTPVCVPTCDNAASYCTTQTFADSCGTVAACTGTTCCPDNCAATTCSITTCNNGCSTVQGTIDPGCADSGSYCLGVLYSNGCYNCTGSLLDTAWSPDPSAVCLGTSFTQYGTTCSQAQASIGTLLDTVWSPDPSTVCLGMPFTQTGATCGQTQAATGTKECNAAGYCAISNYSCSGGVLDITSDWWSDTCFTAALDYCNYYAWLLDNDCMPINSEDCGTDTCLSPLELREECTDGDIWEYPWGKDDACYATTSPLAGSCDTDDYYRCYPAYEKEVCQVGYVCSMVGTDDADCVAKSATWTEI